MAEDAGNDGIGATIKGFAAGAAVVGAAAVLYFLFLAESPEPTDAGATAPATEDKSNVTEDSAAPDEAAPTDSTDDATVAATEDSPEAETSEDEPQADPSDAEATGIPAPQLDLIRVEPDGTATLAGQATPGSRVEVLLNGEPVHSFDVDQSGQFAAFFDIDPSAAPRSMTLRAENGEETALSEDFLIAAAPAAEIEGPSTDAEPGASAPQADPTQSEQTEAEPQQSASDTTETRDTGSGGTEETAQAEPQAEDTQSDTAPVILRSGSDGVELVQSPTDIPAGPTREIQLDTIGYSDRGDVELSGRTASDATVRIYLNNRRLTDLNAGPDGRWRGEVTGIAPGVYTLRLDALGSDGAVISRLETPFKREAPEVLRPVTTGTETQTATIRAITVQEGDTLWAISRDRYGDGEFYVRVFDANRENIKDPDLIYPGQIFNLPE